jgi:hypothetical protein
LLDEIVATRLLTTEAARRATSVERLLAAEVTAKVVPVTDAEVGRFIADNQERMPSSDAKAESQVRLYLEKTRAEQRRQDLLSELKTRARVELLLTVATPYRASIDVSGAPSRGAHLGVNGTPSFFVNGRMLTGALPFEVFDQTIKDELEIRAAHAAPNP